MYHPRIPDGRKTRKRNSTHTLPEEQTNLLLDNLPRLRLLANGLHWKMRLFLTIHSYEDLLQDGLANMLTARTYPPPVLEELIAWASRILRNCALNYAKRQEVENKAADQYATTQYFLSLPDPRTAQWEAIAIASKQLPENNNQVLQNYVNGISGRDQAKALNVLEQTIRSRHFRAHTQLRSLLANFSA